MRTVPRWHASPDPVALGHVLDLVAGCDVRVEIARRFRLDNVVTAHHFAQTGHPCGKVILTVG